jgi:hypothetical protein
LGDIAFFFQEKVASAFVLFRRTTELVRRTTGKTGDAVVHAQRSGAPRRFDRGNATAALNFGCGQFSTAPIGAIDLRPDRDSPSSRCVGDTGKLNSDFGPAADN